MNTNGTKTIPLSVKWGKETVELSYDPAVGVKGLKSELQEKTNVPENRMKLMAKTKGLWKGVLKDDTEIHWDKAPKSSPVQLLLMGSAAELSGPKTKTVFLEDLPPEERAKVAEPAGLVNLGNTCYMNSVVQCLRSVPELQSSLQAYHPNNNAQQQQQQQQPGNLGKTLFLSTLRDTYTQLGRQETAYQPTALVQAVKMAFPQFAQLSPQGHPMQQDAEEFYSGLLALVASETQNQQNMKAAMPDVENFGGANNTVDAVFGMKLRETLTCDECAADGDDANAEPPVISHDLHRKLVCNIQGGSDASSQVNINHVQEGIALGLTGKIEKQSDVLGRNAVWTRTQRIERLAPVVTVQFGRFYWKATPDSQDHAGVKCKVMKPVAFSSTLDVYDFCTPEIQKTLQNARKKALAAEEEKINKKLKGQIDNNGNVEDGGDDKMETDEQEEEADEDLQAALAMSMGEEETFVGPGLPKDFQGYYELFAVVTHKGRDADGGHYMAWVKAASQGEVQKIADTDEDNEDWFVFDDDEVSPCKTEDVLKLKGGGDWHMSYLNFYRVKK